MRKMSWIRSSKGATLVVLLTLSLAVAGPAAALSVSTDGVPAASQVGDSVELTVTVEDPFVDAPDQWTLQGSTELANASWRVTVFQQGETIENGDNTYSGSSFEQPLNASRSGDTVRIEIAGDTPSIREFTYQSNETFALYDLNRGSGNTTIDINATSVYHYTNESRSAREAIMEAEQVINETSGTDQAREDLDNAISFYNSERFGRASDLAQSAQENAQSAQQSSQLLLYGGVGVVVVLLVGGGLYYWRSNQGPDTKLQ
jgi:hypothetical protein